MLKDKKKALEWKKKFNYSNFNPKLIFKTEKTKESLIFSLGFFVRSYMELLPLISFSPFIINKLLTLKKQYFQKKYFR